jgi:dienelactone hydrolase
MTTPVPPNDTRPPCAALPSLLQFADGRPVRTEADWTRRREEISTLLRRTLVGSPPDEVPDLATARTVETTEGEHGRRERVALTFDAPTDPQFEVDVRIPPGDGPFPLFMMAGPYDWWHEVALERGYAVCIYPGADGNDETDVFADAYAGATWSLLLRRAWLGSRALDYMLTRSDVIRDQICTTGHSRNGKQALIAAAFDNRIRAVASSSSGSPGAAPYRFTSRDTFAEAPADFPGDWFRPSLRDATGREHELPIDAHGWLGMIAPRPLLIGTAWNDGCEPTFAVERAYRAGRQVYEWMGHPDRLRIRWRPGGHHSTLDREMVQGYFDWFDRAFDRGSTAEEVPERLIHRFDWDDWRRNQDPHSVDPPDASADRHTHASWLLGESPNSVPWDDRRGEQARGTHRALGLDPPEPVERGTYTFLHEEESALMNHDRWALAETRRIPVSFGENVRGNMYVDTNGSEPAPVVIWLHPLSYQSGYSEGYPGDWAMPDERDRTTIYHRLAADGYAVLAFDQCGFGLRLLEGRDFYDRFPQWSRMGRSVHDVHRAVDFITEGVGAAADPLPALDPDRIALVGYGVGGTVGLFAAALDGRVDGVATVCGFTPWRGDTDNRPTGGIRRWWQWHALLPRLGVFHGREGEIPFDIDDLLAMVAPRPCLIEAPRHDRTADHGAVLGCVNRARAHWRAANRGDHLTLHTPNGPARLRHEQRSRIREWLPSVRHDPS